MTVAQSPPGDAIAPVARLVGIRLYELTVLVLGVVVVSGADSETEILYLGAWDALVLFYLLAGGLYARRTALRETAAYDPAYLVTGWRRVLRPGRLVLVFPFVAGLTGLSASLLVLGFGEDEDIGVVAAPVGVVAILLGWALIHSGYARFYRSRDARRSCLEFPGEEPVRLSDYLYFAFTIGTSFAVSDVSVVQRSMRWHVMVHAVIGFLYNTAVVAVAVGVITRK